MSSIQELLNDVEAFEKTPQIIGYDLRLDLADIVIRRLQDKSWTQNRLAGETKMRPSFITRVIHADSNCTFDVAGRILFALGVKVKLQELPNENDNTRFAQFVTSANSNTTTSYVSVFSPQIGETFRVAK